LSDVGQRIEAEVDAKAETLVATSIPAWPGWRITVDGRDALAVPYNLAFLSFRVPSGRHTVRLVYRPSGFVWGAWLSALTLLAVAVARRREAPAPVPIDGAYQDRARREGFVVQRFWHHQKELVVRSLAPPRAGERALDVGCGSGVVANLLASEGAR